MSSFESENLSETPRASNPEQNDLDQQADDIANLQERKVDVKITTPNIHAKLQNVEIKHVKTDTQKNADSKKNVDSNVVAPIIILSQNLNRMQVKKSKVLQKILKFLNKKLTLLQLKMISK